MKKKKGVWIPTQDNWKGWSSDFERAEYIKLNLNGDLAIDIGAHVGIWSQRLSKDFSEVICFEPLSKHIECHKMNCGELDNVTLIECALSDMETKSVMTTKDNNSGMSSLHPCNFRNKSEEIVKTKTIDNFDFPKMDFIKIDVEGWEEQVILGGIETIKKYSPKIYIEIWRNNYDSISEIFNDMGYSLEMMARPNGPAPNYLATKRPKYVQ